VRASNHHEKSYNIRKKEKYIPFDRMSAAEIYRIKTCIIVKNV
jgi:hypothetical protein